VQPACASAGNTSSTKKAIVAIRNIVTPYVQDDPNPCFRLLLPCVLETAFAAANDDVTRLGQFTDATDHSHSLVLGVELDRVPDLDAIETRPWTSGFCASMLFSFRRKTLAINIFPIVS
jgi:hypothetical protein